MSKHKINWQIHRKGYDAEALKAAILSNLEYRLAKDQYSATNYDRFLSTAYSIVERLEILRSIFCPCVAVIRELIF